jgi:hypothetical protein
MRFCLGHWKDLKADLKRIGIIHLVSKNSTEATARIRRHIEGTAGPEDFCPLIFAHNLITGQAATYYGEGEFCPICRFNEIDTTTGAQWIQWSVQAAYHHCVDIKLIEVH